jgi:hypothetical protein
LEESGVSVITGTNSPFPSYHDPAHSCRWLNGIKINPIGHISTLLVLTIPGNVAFICISNKELMKILKVSFIFITLGIKISHGKAVINYRFSFSGWQGTLPTAAYL